MSTNQKNTWTLRDVLRLSHTKGIDPAVGNFILNGEITESSPKIIQDFGNIQKAETVNEVITILGQSDLPWETMPTKFHKDPEVWKVLFYAGNLRGQALVRNITRLAKMDAFKDMRFAADYAAALTDEDMIKRTRLHPVNYLNAAVVYAEGQIPRGDTSWYFSRQKSWDTSSVIADALNDGFHKAFKYVEPAGKRTLLALDVSGSMSAPAMGLDLSCSQVSAAMAMTVARTEPAHEIRGFSTKFIDLGITAKANLSQAMKKVSGLAFGGTDCAQPMLWALENKVEVDTFIVLTDNETWAGHIKPSQALEQYRQSTGIPAKMIVVAAAGNRFTIADPRDFKGQLDVSGFSSDTPKVIADFSAGRL